MAHESAPNPRPHASQRSPKALRWLIVVLASIATVAVSTTPASAAAARNLPRFSLDAAAARFPAGETVTLVARFTRGVSGDVSFRLRGAPQRTVLAAQRLDSRRYQLFLTPPRTATPGVYSVIVRTINPGTKRSVRVRLDVRPAAAAPVPPPPVTAPPVTLPPVTQPPATQPPPPTVRPVSLRLEIPFPPAIAQPGTQLAIPVTVIRSGIDGPVFLNASGVPVEAAWSFAPNPTTASSILYITVPANARTGSYPITVTGQIAKTTAAAVFTLNIAATTQPTPPAPTVPAPPRPAQPGVGQIMVQPDSYPLGQPAGFGLTTGEQPITVRQGRTAEFLVQVTSFGGFTGPVQIAVTGNPPGTALSVSANGRNRFRVRVQADSNAVVSGSALSISARSGALAATVVRPLSVTPR